jgi:excisionase family DNA binding protein
MNDIPVIYTVKDIQNMLRVSRQTAYDLCNSGKIKTLRVGTSIRVTREAFEEYLNQSGDQNG